MRGGEHGHPSPIVLGLACVWAFLLVCGPASAQPDAAVRAIDLPGAAAPRGPVALPEGTVIASDPTSSAYPLAPPRLAQVTQVGFDVRAFLPINVPAGVGVLTTAFGEYRFDVPIALRMDVNAAGLVTSAPGGATFDGNALVALDTQYFEVGIGPGLLTVTDTNPAGASFELAEFLRIGAVDGLMMQAKTSVYVASGRTQFATIGGMVQVPVTRSWWVQARGMWAEQSWFYGELAARHLLSGNGDRGSLFVTGAVGGTGMGASRPFVSWCCVTVGQSSTCSTTQLCTYETQTRFGGPSVAVGLEWRL
jgi:hypothetical protein